MDYFTVIRFLFIFVSNVFLRDMKLKDGFKGEQSLVLPRAVLQLIESDPLASLLYVTDIGYFPKARHHYRCRETAIDQYVFIYCIDGKGWFELNGEKHEVVANQYFILPAGTAHTYAASEAEPWTIYWIHFKGAIAHHYAADRARPIDVTPSLASRINTRNKLFEEIYLTLASSFTLESIRYACASFQHYLASLRYIQQYRNAGKETSPQGDIADMVIHFFNENIERHLTLPEVAAFSGLSSSRLSFVFKERTGHSPLNYFNLLKVRRACELLDTTRLKPNQISLKLGFDDPYYFSRLFSKIMGLSPINYRNRPKT